jgi:hypothetical protein
MVESRSISSLTASLTLIAIDTIEPDINYIFMLDCLRLPRYLLSKLEETEKAAELSSKTWFMTTVRD